MAKNAPLELPNLNGPISSTKLLGGSRFDTFNVELATQACNTLWTDKSSPENKTRKENACLAAMAGISPQDEIEGMMAVQMIAVHNAAMECYRRAMIGEQTFHGRNQNLNFGIKLSNTYARLSEVLDKHRGKGQQKVTVEHVHVHQGGQAIVGNVTTGGSATISKEQPHAKSISDADEPAMQRTLAPDWETMPMPSNA